MWAAYADTTVGGMHVWQEITSLCTVDVRINNRDNPIVTSLGQELVFCKVLNTNTEAGTFS